MRWLVLALAGCGRIAFGDRVLDGDSDVILSCPRATGHDEDGDGIDDGCDVCPHLADTQLDSDGDQVGDACDPNPSTPSERIAFFDPFTSQRPEWTSIGSISPIYTGDAISQDLSNGRMALGKTSPTQVGVYEVRARIGVASTTFPRQVAIVMHEGNRLMYCEHYDSGPSNLVVTYSPDNVNFMPLAASTAVPLAMGELTLTMRHSLPDVSCTTTWSVEVPTVMATVPGGSFVAANVSFAVQGAFWTVDYFIQINTE